MSGVDRLPPRPPLHQRVDLAAIAAWQADQERARAAYYRLTSSRAKHGDPIRPTDIKEQEA